MNDWLLDAFPGDAELQLPDVVIRLVAALLLGAVVGTIYRVTRRAPAPWRAGGGGGRPGLPAEVLTPAECVGAGGSHAAQVSAAPVPAQGPLYPPAVPRPTVARLRSGGARALPAAGVVTGENR